MTEEKRGPGRPPNNPMFPVKLRRSYVPLGKYEIVAEVEHIYPGVGFDRKLWPGTLVKLPLDEAKSLVERHVAERADAFPSD